jgi:hypothetical protein
MIRFFPDGLVISTDGRSLEVPRSFGRENKYLLRGSYVLDAIEYPAAIQFEGSSTDSRQDIRFIGTFDGEALSPGGLTRFSGFPMLRRFMHHHLDALDSFLET